MSTDVGVVDDSAKFYIHPNNGELSLAINPQNDKQTVFNFNITVDDGQNQMIAPITVSVYICIDV
jgi:hypothetical protein